MKVARTVRRGEVGKGLAEIPLGAVIYFKQVKRNKQYLAGPLPYKQTGWKLSPDGCGIGRVRLVGTKKQRIEEYPTVHIKRVRIVRRADGYYVQCGVAAERSIEHMPTGRQVGIDLGLKEFLTDSEGNTVANPAHLRTAEKRVKRLHRRLSRKLKKSANRAKARTRLAKGYLKVQRQRADFARKTASALITSCEPLCLRRPSDTQHAQEPPPRQVYQ